MRTLVTVQIFTYPSEAHVAQIALESNGIDSFLKDENTVQVLTMYSNSIGGIKLQVADTDVEKAREVLIEGGFISNPQKSPPKKKIETVFLQPETDQHKCPYCGSENIDTIVNPNIWVVIFFFILGVIFPIFKSWEKCYDCQKEWKFKKASRTSNGGENINNN